MSELSSSRTWKAPPGKLYRIHSIHGIVGFAGNNAISVLSRAIEEGDETIEPVADPGSIFYHLSTDVVLSHPVIFLVPVKTKYISASRQGSIAFTATITVNYELISASKADLIWEWFSKRP